MISYTQTHVARPEHVRAFQLATTFVNRCPARKENGDPVRCHELARAVQRWLTEHGIVSDVVDGHFGPVDHSWLRLPGGRARDPAIIDVYSVAQLPPVQLVLHIYDLAGQYRWPRGELMNRSDIDESGVDLLYNAGVGQPDRFDETWRTLSQKGHCDGFGGTWWMLVKDQWVTAGSPEPIAEFIVERANVGPEGP